ncbi:MAG TPA: DUF4236 domain-containing protein [Micromonosporaceae bacterium]|nr:DUF4236 domain-containing protein [Micromonosporaceae bacterium]
MGFSVKLAPGVRIRASSRGIRTSIGPRAARVHVGGGRTGFSTGAGPVSFYTTLGAGRRASGHRTTSTAAYHRQLAAQNRQSSQQQRAAAAYELAQTFLHIVNLHRVDFPTARRPIAPPPPAPDREAIYQHYETVALAGTGRFQRAQRTRARQQAVQWTDVEVNRQAAETHAAYEQYQVQLDEQWRQLCGNQPDVVMETLEEAFDDNEAPAAPVGVESGEASIAILVPQITGAIPEQIPATTPAGNPTLKKLTQRDRADYYKLYVCGQVLVTVKEALAVAPGLASVRIVVLRDDGRDAYGKPRVACILAARFERNAFAGIQWHNADAVAVLNDSAAEKLTQQKGRSQELTPLDVSDEPAIAALIEAVDLDELHGDRTGTQSGR